MVVSSNWKKLELSILFHFIRVAISLIYEYWILIMKQNMIQGLPKKINKSLLPFTAAAVENFCLGLAQEKLLFNVNFSFCIDFMIWIIEFFPITLN